MQVGDNASLRKTITEADVLLFAAISLDTNPAHLDAVQAGQSRFGGRIAHGMLTGSLISGVLGTKLPGAGTIYLEQTLRFLEPVRVGATVEARVEVVEVGDKGRVRMHTSCTDENGKIVVDGHALVIAPRTSND